MGNGVRVARVDTTGAVIARVGVGVTRTDTAGVVVCESDVLLTSTGAWEIEADVCLPLSVLAVPGIALNAIAISSIDSWMNESTTAPNASHSRPPRVPNQCLSAPSFDLRDGRVARTIKARKPKSRPGKNHRRRLLPFCLAIATQDKSDANHSTKARTTTIRILSIHDIWKTWTTRQPKQRLALSSSY